MVKLDPVIRQEPRKECRTREPKSPFKIRGKSNNFARIFIRTIFTQGRTPLDDGFSSKRLAETRVSRSDSEHLLEIHPSSRVGSTTTPFPLVDFFGAIRKSTKRLTRIN